ncbi:MAG: DNA polymerase III subunit alpha [Fimbriimonadaceae bacterium]
MRPAGDKQVLSVWREAGEWWNGEPYREFETYLDAKGVRRERCREYPSLASAYLPERQQKEVSEVAMPDVSRRQQRSQFLGESLSAGQQPWEEDCTEDWAIRIHKTRDEKVARACGKIQEPQLPQKLKAQHGYLAAHVCSGYSFGRGAMLAEEIPALAAAAGLPAFVLADRFSLAGVWEATKIARKVGVRCLVGASLVLESGGEIVLIAPDAKGYRRLSQLVTECHMNQPRLFPLCTWKSLERWGAGLLCLTGGDLGPVNRLLMRGSFDEARGTLERLRTLFGTESVLVQVERSYLPWEHSVNEKLLELGSHLGLLAIAGGLVTHARRSHFPAQDVITCVETLCMVEQIEGRKPARHPDQPEVPPVPRRALNAERFLKNSAEMRELFADKPRLLENGFRLLERCEAEVLPPRSELPTLYADEPYVLRQAVLAGAHLRYRKQPVALKRRIEHELDRIIRLGFSGHFLMAWDLARWAEEQEFVYSGRGSVVDSVVAYCLGLSRIDGFEHRLHFDRFLPEDGSKRPDIDLDFEADKREDVRQYWVQKFGSTHVATVGAFGAFCSRGIVREVGKVMGLPEASISFLSKRMHGGISPDRMEAALEKRPELRDSRVPRERFRWVFRLAQRLMDLPRNLRAHSSGVVVSREPVACYVPVQHSGVEEVLIMQWDKRSAKHCFDKFDLLCLRGNDVLSGVERNVRYGQTSDLSFSVTQIPLDDPETFRAMRSGKLIGIPQSASPAMRQAHIRLQTDNLHDASLVQAGIRPGVGGAVKINELIARRRGKPFTFSCPEMEKILGLTYGIIVFQEQVDQLLQTFCGCTSGEAEAIRDDLYKKRRESFAEEIREDLIGRCLAQGWSREIALEVYDLVSGFRGYGFAQGHALAFAEISVRAIWALQNKPTEYFGALLDAQPAGYYGPRTLANEARSRGVKILPPDVNVSSLRFDVEDVLSQDTPKLVLPNSGLRVPLVQIAGLDRSLARQVVEERKSGGYTSLFDFCVRVQPARDQLELLVLSGCFDALHPNRRATLWAVSDAVRWAGSVAQRGEGVLPLEYAEPSIPEGLADFSEVEKAIMERRLLGLDVHQHLMSYERAHIQERGGISSEDFATLKGGESCFLVGNPIRLRFPPTASGKRVVFFDLEDEFGLVNVTCFDDVYQRCGHAIICSPYVTVIGEAQNRDGHVGLTATRVVSYRPVLGEGLIRQDEIPVGTADFLVG